ncbi:unnamed protein product [Phytophthora fragariaefolia]|uniref:Unnamed protein product n=1 Tax=Phytophthora fragariaefolia TaxID=1490495 RepID=A0A9W6XRD6_9STRA|nr:unnamed protein product [Phytophthora fragariaefolia]
MGRLHRWSLQIQEYDFTIVYRPGSTNLVADAFSRAPVRQVAAPGGGLAGQEAPRGGDGQLTDAEIQEEQQQDEQVKGLLRAGRFGTVEIREINGLVQSCRDCGTRKARPKEIIPPLRSLGLGFVGDRWALDVAGPLPVTGRGNGYVIAAVAYATRFTVAVAVPTHKALDIARFIMERFILVFGPLRELVMDVAPELNGRVVEELVAVLQAKQTTSVPYRPALLRLVEIVHRTLDDQEEMIAHCSFLTSYRGPGGHQQEITHRTVRELEEDETGNAPYVWRLELVGSEKSDAAQTTRTTADPKGRIGVNIEAAGRTEPAPSPIQQEPRESSERQWVVPTTYGSGAQAPRRLTREHEIEVRKQQRAEIETCGDDEAERVLPEATSRTTLATTIPASGDAPVGSPENRASPRQQHGMAARPHKRASTDVVSERKRCKRHDEAERQQEKRCQSQQRERPRKQASLLDLRDQSNTDPSLRGGDDGCAIGLGDTGCSIMSSFAQHQVKHYDDSDWTYQEMKRYLTAASSRTSLKGVSSRHGADHRPDGLVDLTNMS